MAEIRQEEITRERLKRWLSEIVQDTHGLREGRGDFSRMFTEVVVIWDDDYDLRARMRDHAREFRSVVPQVRHI